MPSNSEIVKMLKTKQKTENRIEWSGLNTIQYRINAIHSNGNERSFSTRKYTRKQINSSQQIYGKKLNPMQMQIVKQQLPKITSPTNGRKKKIYNGSN